MSTNNDRETAGTYSLRNPEDEALRSCPSIPALRLGSTEREHATRASSMPPRTSDAPGAYALVSEQMVRKWARIELLAELATEVRKRANGLSSSAAAAEAFELAAWLDERAQEEAEKR